ncbi:hypothetical protein G7Z17_g661 [Cylindrodendrum hubeiense]|uniref:Uncharacterized protein n=1 Tax=Cylindrodendrum hubeiense TaxID=595255 RepID=A0A9P5HMV0_9HYPO|nr:hypothetical protein G7Z17_g661 [Cylindrodendrum hubeiense]
MFDPQSLTSNTSADLGLDSFVESNLLIICATFTTIRRFVAHVAPRIIGERESDIENKGSDNKALQQHSFRTIGTAGHRKKVDKFGMTVNGDVIRLQAIDISEEPEVNLVKRPQDLNDLQRDPTDIWQRLGSVATSRGSVSESLTWDSQSEADEVEAQRAIL